jgi:hypothetical protein
MKAPQFIGFMPRIIQSDIAPSHHVNLSKNGNLFRNDFKIISHN